MKPQTIKKLEFLEAGELPVEENAGFLGIKIDYEDSKIVLLKVPWDGTASYGKGTRFGPDIIIKASHQIDLWDIDYGLPFWAGFCDKEANLNRELINNVYNNKCSISEINYISEHINEIVYKDSMRILDDNKLVGIIGGEHSVPYGLLQALAHRYKHFGILHIDAHHDLRQAFEGYTYSHASIIYNILENIPQVSSIVSIGIRDFCKEEFVYAKNNSKLYTLYDYQLFESKIQRTNNLIQLIQDALIRLPTFVYVSFDIDGLLPSYCPGTGTPVPGGIDFNEAMYIIKLLSQLNKVIIGFDLCEVSPSQINPLFDGNVGARVLYKLCGAMAYTNQLYDLSKKGVLI